MKLRLVIEHTVSDRLACILERMLQPSITDIREQLQIIMSNQAEFDAKITQANEKLDSIAEGLAAVPAAITAEGGQVRQFILDNPSVNTSALDGVVARLDAAAESAAGIASQIGSVFEPPVVEDPIDPPVDPIDPPVDPEA